MRARIANVLSELQIVLAAFDPALERADDAAAIARDLTEIEKLAAAGRTLAAKRVAETGAWRSDGATSPAAWLAERAGITVSAAGETLHAAEIIDEVPELRDAFVGGRLSSAQAVEIAEAAAVDPDAAPALLDLAGRASVYQLKQACRDVRMAALEDESLYERSRRMRYCRVWTDRHGMIALDARLPAADGGPLLLAIEQSVRARRKETLASGAIETDDALAADALCALVRERSTVDVRVLVSDTAIERGNTVAGETCRMEGVGPIPVSAATALLLRGRSKVIERREDEIVRISHRRRTIDARLRTALEVRDPTCVIPGCGRRHSLEIDHIRPLSEGGKTELGNLARLCAYHHGQKTHHGWRLTGKPGAWRWRRGPHTERGQPNDPP